MKLIFNLAVLCVVTGVMIYTINDESLIYLYRLGVFFLCGYVAINSLMTLLEGMKE